MIQVDWHLLLAQIASFLIALLVLWRFFWGPLTQMLEKRRSAINSQIEETRKGKEDTEKLKQEYQRHLAEIDETAKKMLHEAMEEGHAAKEEVLKAAREQAGSFLANAKGEIAAEKDLAMKQMRKETVDLAVMIAEKILKQSVDPATQERMLDEFIDGLRHE